MIINITGNAGSCHTEVGRLLAERLDLHYYSAKDISVKEAINPKLLINLRNHEDDADEFINEKVRNLPESNNYVLDALTADFDNNSTNVLILRDLIDTGLHARRYYNERLSESKVVGEDFFSYDNKHFNFIFNERYLTPKDIVDCIVNSMINGIDKCCYFSPKTVFVPNMESVKKTQRVMLYTLEKYNYFYRLKHKSDVVWLHDALKEDKVIKVSLKDFDITHDIGPVDVYEDYIKQFDLPEQRTITYNIMLSKYGLHYQIENLDETLIDLDTNANPLRRLQENGFDK